MAVDTWREIGTIRDNLQRFAGMQAYPIDDGITVLVLNLANGVAGDETHARNVRKAIDELDEPTALVDVNSAVTAGMGPDVFVPWAIVEVHIEQRPNARMEIPLPLSDEGCLRVLGLVVDVADRPGAARGRLGDGPGPKRRPGVAEHRRQAARRCERVRQGAGARGEPAQQLQPLLTAA